MKHLVHYRERRDTPRKRENNYQADRPRTNTWSNSTLVKRKKIDSENYPEPSVKKQQNTGPSIQSDVRALVWIAVFIPIKSIDLGI